MRSCERGKHRADGGKWQVPSKAQYSPMEVPTHACEVSACANEILPFLPLHNQELMPECKRFVGGVVALRLPCDPMIQCMRCGSSASGLHLQYLPRYVLRVTLKLETFRRYDETTTLPLVSQQAEHHSTGIFRQGSCRTSWYSSDSTVTSFLSYKETRRLQVSTPM